VNAPAGALLRKTPVSEHTGHDNDSRLLLAHKITLKAAYTMLPGSLGGVLANMAVAGNSVYVAAIDLPITATSLSTPVGTKAGGAPTGEVEALSPAAGAVEWDTKMPSMPLGAATVAGDLVFTTLYNGTLIALDRRNGAIVWRRPLPASNERSDRDRRERGARPRRRPRTPGSGSGGQPQLAA
jgi:outer membrane protein assembly factor BamB